MVALGFNRLPFYLFLLIHSTIFGFNQYCLHVPKHVLCDESCNEVKCNEYEKLLIPEKKNRKNKAYLDRKTIIQLLTQMRNLAAGGDVFHRFAATKMNTLVSIKSTSYCEQQRNSYQFYVSEMG